MKIKPHILLTIFIVVIIVIYLIYLNFFKKDTPEIISEGFDGLSDYIDPDQKIKTLINSQISKNFEKEIWNNQTVLDALPLDAGVNFPVNFNECKAIGSRDLLTQCPISIWEPPQSEYGFSHIGHVLSRNFVKPSIEKIIDYRQPKTPAGAIEKGLDTMVVAGANLKDPEDYLYVGSFGSGDFSYNELSNETYKKKINQLINYLRLLIENINTKFTTIQNNINTINQAIIDKTMKYLDRMLPYINIIPANQTTIDNANEILNTTDKSKLLKIDIFKKLINNFQNKDKDLSVKINIEKTNFTVDNGYFSPTLTKNLPAKIRNQITNGIKTNEIQSYTNFFYQVSFSDLESVSNNARIAAYTLGDETISSANSAESSQFSASANLQIEIKYRARYWFYTYYTKYNAKNARREKIVDNDQEVDDSTDYEPIIIGNNDGKIPTSGITPTGFNYYTVRREDEDMANHPRRHILQYYRIKVPKDIYNLFYSDLLDATNQPFYDGFNNTITQIKALVPNAFETTYRTLTIWQPVPPKEYVALGFYFTNKGKDAKPTNTGLKCIPKSCAKSFNRRLWKKEDLLFIYKDQTQHLHFYRNPFLNTAVVIDQNKQNGFYAGKTPEVLKYRSDLDSMSWECFDIVPCVQTCDYVKNLENSLTSSKDVCKAHRSFENKFFDKEETKQSIVEEENKLKKMVTDRKDYLTKLMATLDKMMSEEELYKVIDTGLNRYKLKNDLENQRKLHGAAADKLMKTRGFEVNWTNPQDLSRFKNAILAILKGRFQTGKARDCPVCKLPDNPNLVQIQDLELCYGCLEDAVRELINQKKTAGEAIPAELQEIANNIGV